MRIKKNFETIFEGFLFVFLTVLFFTALGAGIVSCNETKAEQPQQVIFEGKFCAYIGQASCGIALDCGDFEVRCATNVIEMKRNTK